MIVIEGASVVGSGAALGLIGPLLLASRLRLLFGGAVALATAVRWPGARRERPAHPSRPARALL